MKIEAPKNINYAATVVELKTFVDLANCDNVKAAIIFGNSVIVSKGQKEGDVGLFFPVECQLSSEFLASNNQYRKHEYGNQVEGQTGFFEQHGRVKAVKFRGHKSEGFWIPLHSLAYLFNDVHPQDIPHVLPVGTAFDQLNGHEICRKYVPKYTSASTRLQEKGKVAKLEDSIVDGQFRFHFDTANLRRNIHKISPEDFISITDKWHGTSVVISKVLVKRELSWFERVLQRLGIDLRDTVYGSAYSSRRVIKAVNGVKKGTDKSYYSSDVWGAVANEVFDRVPDGFTLYGEIVGFTPDGAPIQSGYTYRCRPGEHRFMVYRVTMTNASGLVVELPYPQMVQFCGKNGFETLPELYYGRAKDLFPNLNAHEHWHENFLKELEAVYVHDQDCPFNNWLPAEGIVVRIDRLNEAENFKLKNFRFLERESKELDKGQVDTETAESTFIAA